MSTIKKGARVRYYQPGVDEILGQWAGEKVKVRGGSVREVTVTKVSREEGVTYYDTKEGVLLTDDDLVEL